MASIKIQKFGGEVPRLAPHLLSTGRSLITGGMSSDQAQLAQNVKVVSGGLRAWKKPSLIFAPVRTGVASFYRMPYSGGDVWLTWTTDVNAVPGAIANDTDYKTYYSGGAAFGPRKTNYNLATNSGAVTECPNDYLELGVPAPTAAPSLSVVGGSGATTTRAYAYTFLTTWGEESMMSPTVSVTGFTNGSWNLSSLQASPAGKYSITKQRIYRTLTDSFGNANFQLVVEQVIATTYNDTVADTALGAICASTAYAVPPTDLTGLISLPNGVMAGFSPSTKQVCFCEPYIPHAWPVAYRYAVEYVPLGIASNGNSVLIATQGVPYIMSGNHPSAMSTTKLPSVEPCASKLTVVDIGVGVVYATQNGFILSSSSGTAMASNEFFSRDEWNKLNPASMMFCKYDDKLMIFYKVTDAFGAVTYGGYILDKGQNVLASTNVVADYVYVDKINAKLYLLQQNQIRQWDGDPYTILSYSWKSRRFIMPRPVNFGVAQVDADYASVLNTSNDAAALALLKTQNQALSAVNTDLKGGFNEYYFNQSDTTTSAEGFTFNGDLLHDIQASPIDQFVTFKVYAGGVLKFTKTLTNRNAFRLPSGFKSDDWTLEVDASVDVNYVKVAETEKELAAL